MRILVHRFQSSNHMRRHSGLYPYTVMPHPYTVMPRNAVKLAQTA
jgi:hypothetical protein